jgi:hypothetical protein
MITVQYAKAFPRIRINAVRMALTDSNGPTGGFVNTLGSVAW